MIPRISIHKRLLLARILIGSFFACTAGVASPSNLSQFYGVGVAKYGAQFDLKDQNDDCSGKVPVRMGVQSDKSTWISPSKIATRGLESILKGNLEMAQKCASNLLELGVVHEEALWFPFQTDYVTTWPYELRAPWVSGFTQGLALGLFTELAKKTGRVEFRHRAAQIFNSYLISFEHGGFARRISHDEVLLEEYPTKASTAVMNGGLVASLALLDYAYFSNDSSAHQLVDDVVRWWERNIHRYDLTTFDADVPVPAYSLAPRRLNILFRFYLGEKPVDVYSIAFHANGIDRAVAVGSTSDGELAAPAYLQTGKGYMNWSDRKHGLAGGTYRTIVPNLGTYDHAPFAVQLTSVEELETFQRESTVSFRYRSEAGIDVQIFDGTEFHKIGTLPPSGGLLGEIDFPIPAAALGKLTFPKEFAFDARHFDDNFELLQILASTTHNKTLAKFAMRWKGSRQFVPFEALNKITQFPFQSLSILPIVTLVPSPSEESIHVEYPTIYEVGNHRVMHYSAYGDDRRWRLKAATRESGVWKRMGNLFNERLLEFTGNYAFPFVEQLPAGGDYKYALYFSAGNAPGAPYTTLWRSFSRDGVKWQSPSKLLEDRLILDPVITKRRGRKVAIYTSKDDGGDVVRMAAISGGRPTTIYRPKSPVVGIYTLN